MSENEFPVKTREVRVRHSSGTIYVERRQYRYDPERRHNVVLKSERIGKISPETGEIVPCRPKRKSRTAPNRTEIRLVVDRGLKERAETLFAGLGLELDAALSLFLRESLRCGGFPFEVSGDENARHEAQKHGS